MPTYGVLMKLTEDGIEDIEEAPARLADGTKMLESMGGKLVGFYTVMGEYDYVGIGELPSDEAALLFSLALSKQGNVRTTTLRAFTPPEFAETLKKLP